MLVLLTSSDGYDFEIKGLYDLTEDRIVELNKLREQEKEINASWKPVWGGTSIGSIGASSAPAPKSLEVPHDRATCSCEVCTNINMRVKYWNDRKEVREKIEFLIFSGKRIDYREELL